MGNEENKAPMAEKIDLTPVEVDPSLSDEAEFGKPDNDSKSYGMFLKAFSIIAALLALFHLYTAQFGILTGVRQRAVHLTIVLVLTFMIKPANRKKQRTNLPPFYDFIFMLGAIVSGAYMYIMDAELSQRSGTIYTIDVVMGVILILLILEACRRLMGWADKYRQLMVYTNADTPRDAAQGRAFGAQGIGLCRTEHMFFEGERIKAMREMIVADNTEDRKKALAKIMPYQQGDFEGLYEAMEGCPVVIRFLDPPLHEFLPTKEEDIKEIAGEIGVTVERLHEVIASLHEFNPMMGHRGCRLAVSYPEIAEMQTTAVINAAINVQKKHPDWKMVPEIMIPLVGEVKELKYVKDVVVATADKIIKDAGIDMKYEVGTMIEIPRAALTADEIAKEAEFFSFGTNDLTQMTFGFSRDDAGKFLSYYYDKKIYESDPFAHLDQNGVGKLVAMAAKLGKETRPDIHLGICGEHGGDPTSVEFCHKVGLNYVSCSPYRVPIARLAAAQAAIKHPRAN